MARIVIPPLAHLMTEAELQKWVIDLAHLRGWLITHYRPAATRRGRFLTHLQGDKGGPDLLLARNSVVILAELKSSKGRLTPEQRAWRDQIGDIYRLWRPSDLEAIINELC